MGIIVGDIDGFIDAQRKSNHLNIAIALLVYFSAIFVNLLEFKSANTPQTSLQVLSSMIAMVIPLIFFLSNKFKIIVGLEKSINVGPEKIKNTITKKEKNVYYFTIVVIYLLLWFLFSKIDSSVGIFYGFFIDGFMALALIIGIGDNDNVLKKLLKETS